MIIHDLGDIVGQQLQRRSYYRLLIILFLMGP